MGARAFWRPWISDLVTVDLNFMSCWQPTPDLSTSLTDVETYFNRRIRLPTPSAVLHGLGKHKGPFSCVFPRVHMVLKMIVPPAEVPVPHQAPALESDRKQHTAQWSLFF